MLIEFAGEEAGSKHQQIHSGGPANRKSSLADLLFDNQSNLVNLHCGHLSTVSTMILKIKLERG